jgi:hypothetical protein
MANKDWWDEHLAPLRERLVGKTIEALEPPDCRDAICRVDLSDGTSFRLHATDLGFWVEDTVRSGGMYRSIGAACGDYGRHHYALESASNFKKKIRGPKVLAGIDVIEAIAPDGREFRISVLDLPAWDRKVAGHPKGLKLIAKALFMGSMWNLAFFERSGCPSEISLQPPP